MLPHHRAYLESDEQQPLARKTALDSGMSFGLAFPHQNKAEHMKSLLPVVLVLLLLPSRAAATFYRYAIEPENSFFFLHYYDQGGLRFTQNIPIAGGFLTADDVLGVAELTATFEGTTEGVVPAGGSAPPPYPEFLFSGGTFDVKATGAADGIFENPATGELANIGPSMTGSIVFGSGFSLGLSQLGSFRGSALQSSVPGQLYANSEWSSEFTPDLFLEWGVDAHLTRVRDVPEPATASLLILTPAILLWKSRTKRRDRGDAQRGPNDEEYA